MNRVLIALCGAVLAAGALAAVRPALFNQEMPGPTAEHKQLVEQGAGEWEGTLTLLESGAPDVTVPAKETNVAIGGFWIHSRFESTVMGMPFTGTAISGYDENKKKYVGTWVDSMSSYLAIMEGAMDAKGEKLIMHWQAPNMTGAMAPHRSVTVHTKDSYTTTFFIGEGDGVKSMELKMKRKAKAGGK